MPRAEFCLSPFGFREIQESKNAVARLHAVHADVEETA